MENKEMRQITRCRRQAPVYAESGCEYLMPDYLPDVRKILMTDAQIRPAGKFTDGDGTEFPGIVTYNVIYLDHEGEIASASFTSEYDLRCKYPTDAYTDAVAEWLEEVLV